MTWFVSQSRSRKVKNTPSSRLLFQLFPSMQNIEEIESGLLPTPASQEPQWKNIPIVDKNGNKPSHPNQRFYHQETGRLVQKGLQQVIEMFPTPTAMDATGRAQRSFNKENWSTQSLEYQVKIWPTPSATPRGAHTGERAGQVSENGKTRTSAKGIKFGATLQTAVGSGSLNPTWVEWLMGYPIGWTDLKDSETQSSLKSHTRSSEP